jgi:DNA-binding response OmpR family regulator
MKDDRPRLLVVDDVADCADCMGLLLEMWGYRVEVAYGGRGAQEAARAFRPHAVLLDVCLPGMDGLRLAEAMRGLPGAAGAPLVAVTGRADEACRARALGAGFAGYLVKPVELDRLRDLLAALVGRAAPAGPLAAPGPPDAVEGARADLVPAGGGP